MVTLPSHGRINCTNCMPAGESRHESGGWQICNDPGAWGASTPKVLVLGFSKGFTQADAIEKGPFDSVAFSGMRPRLKSALATLGIIESNQDIDALLTDREEELAFGSLVRCSLSRKDPADGNWKATGPLIKKAFVEEPAHSWTQACMKTFLKALPERTKLVVLLGNDSGYIKLVKQELMRLYPDSFQEINAVASKAGHSIWVHVAHPSGLNGHFGTWLSGDPSTTAGGKRELALQAINRCGPI